MPFFLRILCAAAAICLSGTAVFGGAASFNAISRDFQAGAISRQQAATYRLYALLAPGRLPAPYVLPETGRPVRHSSIGVATWFCSMKTWLKALMRTWPTSKGAA